MGITFKFKQKMWSEMDLNRVQGIIFYKYSSPNRKRFLCEAWWLRTHTARDSPPRRPWASQPLRWCRDKRSRYVENACTLCMYELFLWLSLPVMLLLFKAVSPITRRVQPNAEWLHNIYGSYTGQCMSTAKWPLTVLQNPRFQEPGTLARPALDFRSPPAVQFSSPFYWISCTWPLPNGSSEANLFSAT